MVVFPGQKLFPKFWQKAQYYSLLISLTDYIQYLCRLSDILFSLSVYTTVNENYLLCKQYCKLQWLLNQNNGIRQWPNFAPFTHYFQLYYVSRRHIQIYIYIVLWHGHVLTHAWEILCRSELWLKSSKIITIIIFVRSSLFSSPQD